MPINKAVLAAFKAATRLRPDIREFYKTQRLAEDVSAKLVLPNPRCRIDEAFATMPDGFEVPLRVFTPLDFDFSLAEGLKVSEDSRGTVLFFHGGGWVNGTVDFYIDACTTMAIQLERRVVSVDYRRAPEHRFPQAAEDCYEVARQLYAGTLLEDVDPDLSRQPRTLVISAEYCPLRDEGEAYAARLELEGDQEVQCYRMLDAVHGYLLYPSVLSLVKDTYRIIKHFLDGDDLTQEGEPAWLGILGTD